MKIFKKELVYTLPYKNKQQEKEIHKLRDNLWEKYEDVQIYHNGLYEMKIVCQLKNEEI